VDGRTIDDESRELIVRGQRVPLTPLGYRLRRHLSSRAGKTVSREELLRDVWGSRFTGGSNEFERRPPQFVEAATDPRDRLGERIRTHHDVRHPGQTDRRQRALLLPCCALRRDHRLHRLGSTRVVRLTVAPLHFRAFCW